MLKFEEQKELETLVVQTINNGDFFFKRKALNIIIACLNSIFARGKFKELDEKKYNLWIMLLNSTQHANLTIICIIVGFIFRSYLEKVVFIFFTITDVAWLSSALVVKCSINFVNERNLFF